MALTHYRLRVQATAGLPAWLASASLLEWVTLPAFKDATSVHAQAVITEYGSPRGVIDAWCGGAIRQSSGHYMLHGGGHSDYFGNEIYALDLFSDSPAWARVWGPSAWADQLDPPVDDYGTWAYNSDGNPCSAHTYYTNQYDDLLDRFVRVTSGSGKGIGGRTRYVDSWNWSGANWNAKGTHPVIPFAPGDGPVVGRDPLTGEIYLWAGFNRSRLNAAGTSWSTIGSTPYSYGEMATAFDTSRNKMLVFGSTSDTYSADWVTTWNPADDSLTRVSTLGDARFHRQMGAAYDPDNDCVWLINRSSELLKYDIATNTTTIQSPSGTGPLTMATYQPASPKGYFNRMQYCASLKALVMAPAYDADTFVIRVA